ncbi:unnamed protein product [Darwinula stevensoni]|uniref:Uncharacterized protein n=1 Tax=Darwinula stevensoni TaxID=69355 RepID=A0A7R9ACS7_9CRUS|nr:unnamed protein product [Darwinula stevensoni]CAG0900615.1 unnamed protein product [Darwinula stevensoni]
MGSRWDEWLCGEETLEGETGIGGARHIAMSREPSTTDTKEEAVEACRNECFYCRKSLTEENATVDYLIKKKNGCNSDPVACCLDCKRKKGTRRANTFQRKILLKTPRCHGFTEDGFRCQNPEASGTPTFCIEHHKRRIAMEPFTPDTLKEAMEACQNECFYCRNSLTEENATVDNLIRKKNGCTSDPVACCLDCKRKKGTRRANAFQRKILLKTPRCRGFTEDGFRCQNPEASGNPTFCIEHHKRRIAIACELFTPDASREAMEACQNECFYCRDSLTEENAIIDNLNRKGLKKGTKSANKFQTKTLWKTPRCRGFTEDGFRCPSPIAGGSATSCLDHHKRMVNWNVGSLNEILAVFFQHRRKAVSWEPVSPETEREAMEVSQNECFYCRDSLTEESATVDNLNRKRKGRTADLVACCLACKTKKGTMRADTFQKKILLKAPRCQALTEDGFRCQNPEARNRRVNEIHTHNKVESAQRHSTLGQCGLCFSLRYLRTVLLTKMTALTECLLLATVDNLVRKNGRNVDLVACCRDCRLKKGTKSANKFQKKTLWKTPRCRGLTEDGFRCPSPIAGGSATSCLDHHKRRVAVSWEPVTPETKREAMEACQNECFYCRNCLTEENTTVDNLVRKNGRNVDLVACCLDCRLKKGTKSANKFQTKTLWKTPRCRGFTEDGFRCPSPIAGGSATSCLDHHKRRVAVSWEPVTPETKREAMEACQNECFYCRNCLTEENATVDNLVRKNGRNVDLVACCLDCRLKKGTKRANAFQKKVLRKTPRCRGFTEDGFRCQSPIADGTTTSCRDHQKNLNETATALFRSRRVARTSQPVTPETMEEAMEACRNECFYCRDGLTEENATVDNLIKKKKARTADLVACCHECKERKGKTRAHKFQTKILLKTPRCWALTEDGFRCQSQIAGGSTTFCLEHQKTKRNKTAIRLHGNSPFFSLL